MSNPLLSPNISEFQPALFQMQYIINNSKEPALEKQEFLVSLRSFLWHTGADNIKFEDIEEAIIAVMPLVGGAIALCVKKDDEISSYVKNEINKMADVMSAYLDRSDFELPENEDPASVISTGCYHLLGLYDEFPRLSLLAQSSVAKEKQQELLSPERASSKSLIALLKKKEKVRIEHLKTKLSELTSCKNCMYNITRVIGDQLLETFEETLYDLFPADADYLLHGLDAFPKNKKVLTFYENFQKKNTSTYLNEQVKKYSDRVKKGMKTTGWEM